MGVLPVFSLSKPKNVSAQSVTAARVAYFWQAPEEDTRTHLFSRSNA